MFSIYLKLKYLNIFNKIYSVIKTVKTMNWLCLQRAWKDRAEITGGGLSQSKGEGGPAAGGVVRSLEGELCGRTERHCSLHRTGETRAFGSRLQGEGARAGAVLEGIIPALSPPAREREPSVGGLPCICLPLPPLPEIYKKKEHPSFLKKLW